MGPAYWAVFLRLRLNKIILIAVVTIFDAFARHYLWDYPGLINSTYTVDNLSLGKLVVSSHSILACPFSGCGFELGSISLVDVSDFGYHGIVRVGIRQEISYGLKYV